MEQSMGSKRSQVSSREQFLTGATAKRRGPATRLRPLLTIEGSLPDLVRHHNLAQSCHHIPVAIHSRNHQLYLIANQLSMYIH